MEKRMVKKSELEIKTHVREGDTGTCDTCGRDVTCEADTEARIVAWLREQPYQWANGLSDLADAIERGDHRG